MAYTILYLLGIMGFILKKKISKNYAILYIIILIIFSGTRDKIGPDYMSYEDIYNSTPIITEVLGKGVVILKKIHGEILFKLLNSLYKYFNLSSKALFFSYSLFTNTILYMYLNRNAKKYIIQSIYIYTTFYFLGENMGQIRYGLASVICLYSTNYIQDKKKKEFVMSVFIASLFQISALIFLPAYLLYHIRISNFIKLQIVFMSILELKINYVSKICLLISKFFFPSSYSKLYYHFEVSKYSYTINISPYQIFMIFILFMGMYYTKIRKSLKLEYLTKFYWMGIVLYFLFSSSAILSARFSEIYLKFSILLIPEIYINMKSKVLKCIYIFLIISASSYVYYSTVYGSGNYLPYSNWLFNK